ncbi:hypothetical protein ACVBEH_14725 [Roseateles sp. GG27B]
MNNQPPTVWPVHSCARPLIVVAGLCMLLLALCACTDGATQAQRARSLYKAGDFSGALIATNAALERDALDGEVLLLRGRIYVEQGDGGNAQIELRKALALGVGHEVLDAVLAKAMLLDGQAERLLTELTPSARHQGEVLAGLHVARGLAQLALGQVELARASFALALEAVPTTLMRCWPKRA